MVKAAGFVLFLDAFNIPVCTMVDVFFFQAEDGIRDLVRSRGLGDVYKRQLLGKSFDLVLPERTELFL